MFDFASWYVRFHTIGSDHSLPWPRRMRHSLMSVLSYTDRICPSSSTSPLCRKPLPSAMLQFSGEVAHGLLRDDAAFISGEGSFRLIDCGKNFCTGALAFFPQGKGLLYRIFFAVEPSALNRLTDKRLFGSGVSCSSIPFRVRKKHRFRQVTSWNTQPYR
jgi:hypothetical protein